MAFIMSGNLGEDISAIQDTINLGKKLNPDYCQFTIATPYPGSELSEILTQKGLIRERDWSKYDESTTNFASDTLSHQDINDALTECYKQYYLRPRYLIKEIMRLRSPNDIKLLITCARKFRNR